MENNQEKQAISSPTCTALLCVLTEIDGVIMNEKLEELARLEHDQWAHWTEYMLDNLTAENIERWRLQIETPYNQLTEKEKESDRVWARKTLAILDT